MSKWAILFPGQGAQHVGMGRDVAEASPEARAVYDRANEILGFDLAGLCFDGPPDALEATDVQQPAIFVTSVAIWRAWREKGGEGTPDAYAGLSLGEYTALHAAGALSFEDALRLVRRRGELLQAAAEASDGGMVSVAGLSVEQVEALCEAVSDAGTIVPANFNCPGQVVISGAKSACRAALSRLDDFGGRGMALKVAGAFHSPLMQPAADGLRQVLVEVEFRPPSVPVVANVNADYHRDPATIRTWLGDQVGSPVRWQACIERMRSDQVDRFVEIGPGRVLKGLMRKIDRSVECVNISTASDLAACSVAPS